MSRSRAKGTAFESAVVAYLREAGFPYAERRALGGARDRGDIAGLPGVVLELKNERRIALGEYMTEAEAEAGNAGARIYAAVVKRRMRPVGESFVVMPLDVFARLLAEDQEAADADV